MPSTKTTYRLPVRLLSGETQTWERWLHQSVTPKQGDRVIVLPEHDRDGVRVVEILFNLDARPDDYEDHRISDFHVVAVLEQVLASTYYEGDVAVPAYLEAHNWERVDNRDQEDEPILTRDDRLITGADEEILAQPLPEDLGGEPATTTVRVQWADAVLESAFQKLRDYVAWYDRSESESIIPREMPPLLTELEAMAAVDVFRLVQAEHPDLEAPTERPTAKELVAELLEADSDGVIAALDETWGTRKTVQIAVRDKTVEQTFALLTSIIEDRIANQWALPGDVETQNDFLVGSNGDNLAPVIPVGEMDRAKALRLAAWLSILADPIGLQFARVRAAIART